MIKIQFSPEKIELISLLALCALQGRITVTGQLDREQGDSYTLTVVADDGGPKRDSTVVMICSICRSSSLKPSAHCREAHISSYPELCTIWPCLLR